MRIPLRPNLKIRAEFQWPKPSISTNVQLSCYIAVIFSCVLITSACDSDNTAEPTEAADDKIIIDDDTDTALDTETDSPVGHDTDSLQDSDTIEPQDSDTAEPQDSDTQPTVENPTVTIGNGEIMGLLDGTTNIFKGIPYGAPPTGANRFAPPVPAPEWDDILDASEPGPYCIQTDLLTEDLIGEEDCLTLNVWARADQSQPRPVMVWLHGGAFIYGSGSEPMYDGSALSANGDVVVVTINYRLGALGFLAHQALDQQDPTGAHSGNWGILNQRLALEWVAQNIAAFGGDPSNITLFGQSAGGISVGMHLVSPGSKGLFHRAIVQSGPVDLFPTKTHAAASERGAAVAAKLGCTDPAQVTQCLRSLPAEQIVEVFKDAEQLPGGIFFQSPETDNRWGPTIDGKIIPMAPGQAIAQGAVAPVPVILGTTTDEGPMFLSDLMRAVKVETVENYQEALHRQFGDRADDVIEAYPPANYETPDDALAAVNGDAFFVCPSRTMARNLSKAGIDTHIYSFEYAPEGFMADSMGVFHAAEVAFVFGMDNITATIGEDGKPLADHMGRAWSAFARGELSGFAADGVQWPIYEAITDSYFVFDLPIGVRTGHQNDICNMWDTIL